MFKWHEHACSVPGILRAVQEQEWVLEPDHEPAERVRFDDLSFIDDVGHPTRGPLLRRFREPRTVAEVADLLDVPVTRLYHHVNQLVDRGLIRAVATRQVGARTETRYQVVARSFEIDSDFLESSDSGQLAAALGSLFDIAKHELQRQIEEHEYRPRHDEDSVLSLGEVVLTPERRADLVGRLRALVEEFASDVDETDPDATRTTLFISAFPSD